MNNYSDSSSTSEVCFVRYGNSVVEVTELQLAKVSAALKVPITTDILGDYVNSPFPLREICLEDFEVNNSEIKQIQ